MASEKGTPREMFWVWFRKWQHETNVPINEPVARDHKSAMRYARFLEQWGYETEVLLSGQRPKEASDARCFDGFPTHSSVFDRVKELEAENDALKAKMCVLAAEVDSERVENERAAGLLQEAHRKMADHVEYDKSKGTWKLEIHPWEPLLEKINEALAALKPKEL